MLGVEDYVNEGAPTATLSDLPGYVAKADEDNPIDEFKASLIEVIQFGNVTLLSENDFLGGLLLLSLLAAVENYVRSVISASMAFCPVCQTSASDKTVNLAGVVWHSGDRYSRSAFENMSLADAKSFKTVFRDYMGLSLPEAEFRGLLLDYEKICQLRHGIVHSNGFLPAKNALKLEIPRHASAALIVIRFKQLQEVAAVLNALITSLNRFLFSSTCRRWATEWRSRADWDPSLEDLLFARIWSLFLSRSELVSRPGRSKITRSACKDAVKSLYGI